MCQFEVEFQALGRMNAAVNSIFRRVTGQGYGTLRTLAISGKIKGFVPPYLDQQDARLPFQSSDLVTRDQVITYPMDFLPMSDENIKVVSQGGE